LYFAVVISTRVKNCCFRYYTAVAAQAYQVASRIKFTFYLLSAYSAFHALFFTCYYLQQVPVDCMCVCDGFMSESIGSQSFHKMFGMYSPPISILLDSAVVCSQGRVDLPSADKVSFASAHALLSQHLLKPRIPDLVARQTSRLVKLT